MAANVYFDLTRAFNARGPAVALASGQAVVFYRVAIMSKDGDWVIREEPDACARVLGVLEERRAWYRPGAPLDVRWLSGGWSSHFEYRDAQGRRVTLDSVQFIRVVSLSGHVEIDGFSLVTAVPEPMAGVLVWLGAGMAAMARRPGRRS